MTKRRKVAVVAGLAVVVVVLAALPIMKNVKESREREAAVEQGREDGRAVAGLMMGEVLRNIELDALVGGPEALTIASLRRSVPFYLDEQYRPLSGLLARGTRGPIDEALESLRNDPRYWTAFSADPNENKRHALGLLSEMNYLHYGVRTVLDYIVLNPDNPRNSLLPALFTLGAHGDEEEEQEIKLLTEVSDSEMEAMGGYASVNRAVVQQAVRRFVYGVNRLILGLPDCTGTSC
ncbi:MAG: hypothetical protein HOE14_09535 [Gemmatimonadales bacterium]|jgi:hypothetical protein|nr:hypothetical protein [Gemmatimonadales bacterium]